MKRFIVLFILCLAVALTGACRRYDERTAPYNDLEKLDNTRIEWLNRYCGKPPYEPRQNVDAEICLNDAERKQTRNDYNY